MFGEYKYSVWSLSVKLFLTCFASIFINILVMSGLLGLFENAGIAWDWFVQALSLMIHFLLVFLFASADGRRDILVDSANEKRAQRYEDFKYENKFDKRKGFLAGAIAQGPVILLFLVWVLTGSKATTLEFIINIFYSPYFQLRSLMGVNILSVTLFTALYSGIAGLSYLSAQSYKKKIKTIIKRNEEKAQAKGIKPTNKK